MPAGVSGLAVIVVASLLGLWVALCGGAALAGRRVPPGLVFAPHAGVLALAGLVVMWTQTRVPWDPRAMFPEARAALVAPDAWVRGLLGPALIPSLALAVLFAAVRGPMRGPRSTAPALVAFGFASAGLLGLSVGALLDGAPGAVGALLLVLVPLGLLATLAAVRGAPDSPGPEAGVIAAVAFGHAVLAGSVGLVASARLDAMAPFAYPPDPAAWRLVGAGLAWLAALGMGAAALTGCTTSRGRVAGAGSALASHLFWLPILLSGALGQMF